MNIFKKVIISLIMIFSFTNLASCSPSKVLINFNTNGGTPIDSIKIDFNSQIPQPADPSKDGSIFKYWSRLNEENSIEYDFNFRVKSNITLFAHWDNYTSEGLEFKYKSSNNSYLVSKGTVCETDTPISIAIPATYNGLKVAVADYGFQKCQNITALLIEGVDNIGDYAFAENSNLSSVILSDGITRIWPGAFRDCTSLTTITIPDSVTSIGHFAFYNCSRLSFIQIPNSVSTISDKAFYNCDSLSSISIPDSITSIGHFAFGDCDNLMEFIVAADNLNYQSQDGVLFNKDGTHLIAYPVKNSQTTYSIPRTVTSINDYAFYNCSNLIEITFEEGSQLNSIGINAFADCINLNEVIIPKDITNIKTSAFANCRNLMTISFASGNKLKTIGSYAFYNCINLSTFNIPSTVTTIYSFAFAHCYSLNSITIPSSVTTIGSAAFSGWTSEQNINIPSRTSSPAGWTSTWDFDCAANIYWAE